MAVSLLALALAAPAMAQSSGDEGAGGLYQGLCKGVGSMAQSLAELFGMSTDELSQARQDGKTLNDLAEDKGLSEDQVLDTILQTRKQALQQAVEEGSLSQEQADSMLERMEGRMKNSLDQPAGPGAGGCSGPGGGPGAGAGAGCGGPGAGPGGGALPEGTSI
jgi:hypothetical protein